MSKTRARALPRDRATSYVGQRSIGQLSTGKELVYVDHSGIVLLNNNLC